MMETNQLGLNLIKSFEGCHLTAYKLSGEKYYTIGYGHSFDNSVQAGTTWTQTQADNMLKQDLKQYEKYVNDIALSRFNLNENQFSALVSYCYNRGPGGLRQLINNSNSVNSIGDNITVFWGSAILYYNGLMRRRRAEQALFKTPVPQLAPKHVKKSPGEYTVGTVILVSSYYKSRNHGIEKAIIKKRKCKIIKIYPTSKNPYQLGTMRSLKKFGYCNYGDIVW